MKLVVDVGNSNTVLGVYEGAKLKTFLRMGTDPSQTADELRWKVVGLLQQNKIEVDRVSVVVVGTVVPELEKSWRQAFKDKKILVPRYDSPWSFQVALPDSKGVGPDRLANTEAALARHQGPSLVIDAGTATTFDVVDFKDGKGSYQGGVIVSGVGTSLNALLSHAARLRSINVFEGKDSIPVIGNSTETALRSGVIYGFSSMVEGLCQRIADERSIKNPKIFVTGGFGEYLTHDPRLKIELISDLTLDGFRLVAERMIHASF